MEKLPIEMILQNLKELNTTDLNNMCMTNKFIRNVCNTHEKEIYSNLIKKEFGIADLSPKSLHRLFTLINKEEKNDENDKVTFFSDKFNFFTDVALKNPDMLEYYYRLGFDFTELRNEDNQTIFQSILYMYDIPSDVTILNEVIPTLISYYKNLNNQTKEYKYTVLEYYLKLKPKESERGVYKDTLKQIMVKTDKQFFNNAFKIALQRKSMDIINVFLENGMVFTNDYIYYVIDNPDVEVFKTLVLQNFFTPELAFEYLKRDNQDVFYYIIDLPYFPINIQNSEGNTLLMECFIMLFTQEAELLMEYGADVNIQNNNGDTIAHLFYLNEEVKNVFKHLKREIKAAAKMNLKNIDGLTPKDDPDDDRNLISERYDIL